MKDSIMEKKENLKIVQVSVGDLNPEVYNPRKWDSEQKRQLKESVKRYGLVDPLLVNGSESRKNVVIGGHFRLEVARELGYTEVPVVYIDIPNEEKERELNVRLNKNLGEFDFDRLIAFTEDFLKDVGFSSVELDRIFDVDDTPEQFDLQKELKKLDIESVTMQKGEVWALGESRLMVGDSTVAEDMATLMGGEKADMCLTEPPYILDYLRGKKKGADGGAITGFGAKRDRRYLETDVLPDNFTESWMANVHASQKEHFSIICYENWKNIPVIWGEMEKYWKIKNMLVWHLENRHQGFSAARKFFSKHDIAMVGASPNVDIEYNHEAEEDGLQEEYETALFAISGKPHWEGYAKGGKYCPTDFIEFKASDEASSGQGVIFGTKPIEILIPYIKVLTKRGDLIVEPFGGSGSTLIAATKMQRRCNIMEKSPTYAEVIKKRWEKLTGLKGVKVADGDAAPEPS